MAKKENTIGKYRVLEEIAGGSFGRVYRGEDAQRNNAPVAIKLLHSANLSSEQERDTFLQEARFLTMLKHPNILPVLDVGIEGNLPYIVTEFAHGGSLLNYLKKLTPRPLPTSEALHIIVQVGQALQYAHQQNIVHRDLKPANILFSASGTAMLADFGIATMLGSSKQYGTVIGTPSYMAPEQFRGTISKEGDQYALGCITYELVTGRRPFIADDFFTLGAKHMSETPIPPTQLNMLLSRSLEQVIFKAMAKKRNERYPSVAVFIAALSGGVQPSLSAPLPIPTYTSSQSPLPPPPPPVAIINATTLPSATSTLASSPSLSATVLPQPSTQPPVMRLDKNAPTKSYSPTDSLPRAFNGAIAEAELPIIASTPIPQPFQSQQQLLPPDGGLPEEDSGRRPGTGYETVLMTGDDDDSVPVRSMPVYNPVTPPPDNSGTVPVISPVVPPVSSKYPWSSKRKLLITAVALLLVLLITSTTLFAALKIFGKSASTLSTATVTIIPTDPTQSGTYTIVAVPGRPSALQVQARKLTATAQQTNTVASSGVGAVPATFARGLLILYNDSTAPQPFAAGAIYTGSDGVQVVSMQGGIIPAGNPTTNPLTWQSVTIPARALKAGQAGNIVKNDVNIWKPNGNKSNFVVQNTAPFNSGRDTLYYPVVENNDLTTAVTPLTRMLLREAQTAVIAQVQPNEQVAATTSCTQQATYNHHAGDHAATLSVTIVATCTLAAYDQQGAFALAINQLKHSLITGGKHALLPVFTAIVLQAQVLDSKGTISLQVKASNSEFSTIQLQNMARGIVGKSSSDAQTTLLHIAGIKQATIHINGGDGQTLPTDVTRITITVSG